jgi:putative N6-adenine-specific DNA methylase
MFKVTKIRQSILTAMWGVTASVSTLALANEEIDTGITAEQQAQVVNAKDVKKLSDVIVTAQYRAQNIQKGTRMVSFYGDKGFMYKANLGLRTALKILKPIYSFKVFNEKGLYNGIQSVDWSVYLNNNQSFVIETTLYSEAFTHSQFVALKVKDAIVDQFREQTGSRPNIDKEHPDLRIHIHIDRDLCTVSLDTSGASLHHRGYRTATNIAPINEVLAAGILL